MTNDETSVAGEEPPARHWPGSGTTPQTHPTGPEDYALLNGIYVASLAGLAALVGRQRRRGSYEPIPLEEVPLLAAATFALAHVLAKEKVSTWLREPFVEESGDHRPVRPEGSGMRYAVGELLTCTRCLGAWAALGLVGARTASPAAGRAVSTVLAVAGANNVLQAGFNLLTARANTAEAEAQARRSAP